MRINELEGAKLDYWVARAEGYDPDPEKEQLVLHFDGTCRIAWHEGDPPDSLYDPSRRWMWGGPIIERECISLVCWAKDSWGAYVGRQGAYFDVYPCDNEGSGSTALIAAMRAYVASKFGEEVPGEMLA